LTQFATSALGGCATCVGYRVTHKAGQCIALHLLARVQHSLCAPAACEQPCCGGGPVQQQPVQSAVHSTQGRMQAHGRCCPQLHLLSTALLLPGCSSTCVCGRKCD
jgi:hypothetical protein